MLSNSRRSQRSQSASPESENLTRNGSYLSDYMKPNVVKRNEFGESCDEDHIVAVSESGAYAVGGTTVFVLSPLHLSFLIFDSHQELTNVVITVFAKYCIFFFFCRVTEFVVFEMYLKIFLGNSAELVEIIRYRKKSY